MADMKKIRETFKFAQGNIAHISPTKITLITHKGQGSFVFRDSKPETLIEVAELLVNCAQKAQSMNKDEFEPNA